MRVLLLTQHMKSPFGMDGSFRVRYQTACEIAKKGHEVCMVYPSEAAGVWPKRFSALGVNFIETPGVVLQRVRKGGFGFLDTVWKSKIVFESRFDIVHCLDGHRPAHFFPCLFAKVMRSSRIIDECWEWLGKGGYSDVRAGFVGRALGLYDGLFEIRLKCIYDHIITISSVLRRRLDRYRRVSVIHGGSESGKLRDYPANESRDRMKIRAESFLIGMSNVGKADHKYNGIFFKAFREIANKFQDTFLVVTGSDADYVKFIEREYSIEGRLIFRGWVDFEEYNLLLSSCDVFVLPLPDTVINSARWPNKLSDYLCLNRPIVTNPTGDVRGLFEKHKLGVLCEHSVPGFVSAIEKLVTDRDELSDYCLESSHVAQEVLSFEKRVEEILQIYEDVYKR